MRHIRWLWCRNNRNGNRDGLVDLRSGKWQRYREHRRRLNPRRRNGRRWGRRGGPPALRSAIRAWWCGRAGRRLPLWRGCGLVRRGCGRRRGAAGARWWGWPIGGRRARSSGRRRCRCVGGSVASRAHAFPWVRRLGLGRRHRHKPQRQRRERAKKEPAAHHAGGVRRRISMRRFCGALGSFVFFRSRSATPSIFTTRFSSRPPRTSM